MNFNKYHVSRNLFDSTILANNYNLDINTGLPVSYSDRCATLTPIDVSDLSNVTITYSGEETPSFMYSLLDDDNTLLSRVNGQVSGKTINVSSASKLYICFYKTNVAITSDKVTNIMLNEGSSDLPYEPYGNTWINTPYYIHNTSTDTITTLPAVLYPNDTTATVGLKGNMEQSGTPTSTNPIQPQETGERTENLFDYTTMSSGGSGYLKADGSIASGSSWAYTDYIPCDGTLFVLGKVGGGSAAICFYDSTKTYIYGQAYQTGGAGNLDNIYCTVPQTAKYIRFTYNIEGATAIDLSTIMLNTGSTAKPFEPYGYKIPISSNSTTTPVYLGEVQSTRRIQKIVFTGSDSEGWTNQTLQRKLVSFPKPSGLPVGTARIISSHFVTVQTNNPAIGELYVGGSWVNFNYDNVNDLDTWKTYLQQQYAAGTPVCVWYVLAESTTGIVNEPIRKIGDYADEVSNVSIPVTAGANTLSVDTTLQPSEVSVNYKGWHPVADVHERDDGAWT